MICICTLKYFGFAFDEVEFELYTLFWEKEYRIMRNHCELFDDTDKYLVFERLVTAFLDTSGDCGLTDT